MTHDSLQSIEKSRSAMNWVRGAVAAATLTTMIAADRVLSQTTSENPSAGKPELAQTFDAKMARILKFDPRSALAAAFECVTDFTLRIHAPENNPSKNIVGTRVEIYNPTNPGEKVTFVAVEQQNYSPEGNYWPNAIVEGSDKRSALVHGFPTGERFCDQPKDRNVCDNGKVFASEGGKKIKTTNIAGIEVDQSGKPFKDHDSRGTVDCPSFQVCEAHGDWKADVDTPPQDSKPPVKVECPPDTKMVGENPLVCERIVVVGPPVIQQ